MLSPDLQPLLERVLEAIATVAAGYAVAVLRRLAKRLKIQTTAETEEHIRTVAKGIVLHVEEWAALRAANSRIVVTWGEKLKAANDALASRFPQLKDPDILRIINAALGELGLGAAASGTVLRVPSEAPIADDPEVQRLSGELARRLSQLTVTPPPK